MIFSLFTKLGVFPIHFWVPGIASGLNWFPLFILLGWQKIAPLALLNNVCENSPDLNMIILLVGGLRCLVGAIIGLNQRTIRAILGGSSIAHTGWACIGVICGGLWTYFFIYCRRFLLLIFFILLGEEIMAGLRILGLRGLPPFIIFIGKWAVVKRALIEGFSFIYLILPIFRAIISLFFYLKFFYSFYLIARWRNKRKYADFCSFLIMVARGVVFIILF